jgi:C-terminal processing protease CtpA/Prc
MLTAVFVSCDDEQESNKTGTKRIGYLVFNFFAEDDGDKSKKYVKELNEAFGQFKRKNVSELILDLRYNSGGALSMATYLASMISNRKTDDVFQQYRFNDNITKTGQYDNKSYFVNKIDGGNIAINKLGLNRLYVLTSKRTASASEAVINGLKPYMDVILIGDTTVGKNVGSISITAENEINNSWGMQPIVLELSNKDSFSNYSNGFIPDIYFNEFDYMLAPLGDIEHDPLLFFALNDIGVTKMTSVHSSARSSDNVSIETSYLPDNYYSRGNAYVEMNLKTAGNNYENINEWIINQLDYFYLWNDKLHKDIDKSLSPDLFFHESLYEGDRFSFIVDDYNKLQDMLVGVNYDAGYDYQLLYYNQILCGTITYVLPNSPAEQAGLKRGDIFIKINDNTLTFDNYQYLTDAISHPHTLGIIVDLQTLITKTVSISTATLKKNPILLDTIYYFK